MDSRVYERSNQERALARLKESPWRLSGSDPSRTRDMGAPADLMRANPQPSARSRYNSKNTSPSLNPRS